VLPSPLNNIFTINQNVHSYNTRQPHDFHFMPMRYDIVFKSFIHQGPQLWSELPNEIKCASSRKAFVSRIKKYILGNYI